MREGSRRSDRWITPGVIIAAIVVGGLVVLGVAAAVTYLTARGVDADPMVKLVATIVGALGSLATLLLQLVGRVTVTKVERNTGALANVVADALTPAPTTRQAPAAYPGRPNPQEYP